MSLYLHVLIESAWVGTVAQSLCTALSYLNHLIFPFFILLPETPSSETTFFAMQSFGGYNMKLACALAISGATLGQLFNWLVGKILLRFNKANKAITNDARYTQVVTLFKKYGVFLLIFSWIPLGNLIVVLAGMARMRLRAVLPLVIFGQLFNYGRYLF